MKVGMQGYSIAQNVGDFQEAKKITRAFVTILKSNNQKVIAVISIVQKLSIPYYF